MRLGGLNSVHSTVCWEFPKWKCCKSNSLVAGDPVTLRAVTGLRFDSFSEFISERVFAVVVKFYFYTKNAFIYWIIVHLLLCKECVCEKFLRDTSYIHLG